MANNDSYHFTQTEKIITDMSFIDEILYSGQYMTLALCRDNEPYVVTISYGYDKKNNALYSHCSRNGLKLDFIRSNNKVCGTVFRDEGYIQKECGQPYRSVVFRGEAAVLTELDEKKNAMSVLLNHLEEDPSIIKQKSLDEDKRYNAFSIIRIDIKNITGKTGR